VGWPRLAVVEARPWNDVAANPQVCSEAWLVKAGQVYCNVRRDDGEELFSMDVTDRMFDFVP